MPTYDTWKEAQNLEKVLEHSQKARLLHIQRPVLLHDRKSQVGHRCPCCGSDEAAIIRKIPHIEVLIDVWKGDRTVRTRNNAARFDDLANGPGVEKVYMPFRVSVTQWKFVRDMRHCIRRGKFRKVTALFGGNRSGKTTIADGIEVDLILLKGGPGKQFWNVAPTQQKAMISVRKLCEGEADAVTLPPLLHPTLVRDYPRTEQQIHYKPISLIDGTKVFCKHAHGNGDNLKGDPAQGIFVDEGCSIRDIANWHVMLNRTMGTKGCLFVSTTPTAGHWLKDEVHTPGVSLEDATDADLIISDRLSCFDNPWYSQEQISDTIEALGDPRLIAREVHGEWVPMGNILWEHWDARKMATKGWRSCEDLGYRNITPELAAKFFKGHAGNLKSVGGLDYNRFPMSFMECQIGVHEDCETPHDPKNWHVFVLNEVVENGGTQNLCQILNDGTAAKLLGLKPEHFQGFPIAADATGSLDNVPSGHGVNTSTSSSLASYMKLQGFDVKPCNRSLAKGRPENPGVLDRLQLLHTLMFEGRLHVSGDRCKKLIHTFEAQEAKPDGKPDKGSGDKQDKLSGPSDALTYLCWAMLSNHEPGFRKLAKWSKTDRRAA